MTTKKIDDGGAAYPIPADRCPISGEGIMEGAPGMTLRQLAAITLRIPNSGTPWLDEMILERMRDDFATAAMQAQVATDMVPGRSCASLIKAARAAGQDPIFRLALNSYEVADAAVLARKSDVAALLARKGGA